MNTKILTEDEFVLRLVSLDFATAIRFCSQYAQEHQQEMSTDEWQKYSDGVINRVITYAETQIFPKSDTVRYWSQFALDLLRRERAQYDDVDLSNDETCHQLAAILDQCFVFGVYHGLERRVPRRIGLKFLATYPLQLGPLMVSTALSPAVLELHLPKLRNKRFSEDYYLASHMAIADLLRLRPDIKGVYNENWYFDPAVGLISPHLAYLSELANAHGSLTVQSPSDESAIEDATLKSSSRRAKFEAGEYHPRKYARIWPSASLIKWADNNVRTSNQ